MKTAPRNNKKELTTEEKSVDSSKIELSTGTFIERMEVLTRIVGSVNALAKKAEISQGGIRRYFTGGEPTLSILIALAKAASVNVLWLATGEGPMRPGDPTPDGSAPGSSGPALNAALLQSVLIAVRQATSSAGRTLTPAQEAQLITGVYELCRTLPPGSPIASSAILPFLSAIK